MPSTHELAMPQGVSPLLSSLRPERRAAWELSRGRALSWTQSRSGETNCSKIIRVKRHSSGVSALVARVGGPREGTVSGGNRFPTAIPNGLLDGTQGICHTAITLREEGMQREAAHRADKLPSSPRFPQIAPGQGRARPTPAPPACYTLPPLDAACALVVAQQAVEPMSQRTYFRQRRV